MRPALVAATAAILIAPLAACKQQPTVSATNATQKDVQEKVAAATGGAPVMIEPGRWEGTMTMRDLKMPNLPANLPPAVREQMKARMGATHSFVNCVTPEDVKAQKAFFTGDEDDESCKYDHFTLSGGRIDAAMSCNRGDDGKIMVAMAGTYSPDAYHLDMSSKAEGAGPAGATSMKMSIDAKRVGACKGTEDEF